MHSPPSRAASSLAPLAIVAGLFAVLFAALYLFVHPSLFYQPFDSLSYGYATERMGLRMMYGNHPLGHVLLGLPYAVARLAGSEARALPSLAAANSLLAAAGLAAFCVLNVTVHRLRLPAAAGLTLILGATYYFWWYAGTADVYQVALLFQVAAWAALVHELNTPGRRTLWLTGLFAGLSILAHQVNALFVLPVFFLAVFEARGTARRRLVTFSAALIATAVVGYLIFGVMATGSFAPAAIWQWLRGYVGMSTYGGNLKLANLAGALGSTARAILAPPPTAIARYLGYAILLLLLFPVGAWLVTWLAVRPRNRRRDRVIIAALLQCLATWLAVFWWEPAPQNPKFWLLLFVPYLLASGYSWEAVTGRWSAAATAHAGLPAKFRSLFAAAYLPLLGLLLLFFTYKYAISFQQFPNEVLQTGLEAWVRNSAAEDLIFPDSTLEPFLRYWAERPHTAALYAALGENRDPADPLANLRTLVDGALCANRAVLYTPLAVDSLHPGYLGTTGVTRADLHRFFDGYARELLFSYITWVDGSTTPVYRLLPAAGSCPSEGYGSGFLARVGAMSPARRTK